MKERKIRNVWRKGTEKENMKERRKKNSGIMEKLEIRNREVRREGEKVEQ